MANQLFLFFLITFNTLHSSTLPDLNYLKVQNFPDSMVPNSMDPKYIKPTTMKPNSMEADSLTPSTPVVCVCF